MTHSTPSVPSLAPGTIMEETCLWAPCISMLYAATSWSPQTPHLQFWKILGDWLVEVQNLSVGRNSKPKNTVLRTFRASCFGISPPMNKTFLIGAWLVTLKLTMTLNHWCNNFNPEPSASSVLCKWPVSVTQQFQHPSLSVVRTSTWWKKQTKRLGCQRPVLCRLPPHRE